MYRQFSPNKILTIRSDCILVKETAELPSKIEKNKHLYKIKFFKKLKLNKELEIFDCETNTLLKSPKSGLARQRRIEKLQQEKNINI